MLTPPAINAGLEVQKTLEIEHKLEASIQEVLQAGFTLKQRCWYNPDRTECCPLGSLLIEVPNLNGESQIAYKEAILVREVPGVDGAWVESFIHGFDAYEFAKGDLPKNTGAYSLGCKLRAKYVGDLRYHI